VLHSALKKSSKLVLIGFIAKNCIPKVLALLEEVARRQKIVIGLILHLEDLFYPSVRRSGGGSGNIP